MTRSSTCAAELFARRVQYETAGLDVADVAADPIEQWQRWYDDASSRPACVEPNAMVLATVDADGQPDARYVLVRGVDDARLRRSTPTTRAPKSRQLDANPRGAGVFTWLDLHRQVRVRGPMSSASRRRERRLLRLAAARQPDRRVGVAAERRCSPIAPTSTRAIAAVDARVRGSRRRRARRSGAAGASASTRSSSGRAARAASTTASATAATRLVGGWRSDWRREDPQSVAPRTLRALIVA